MPGQPVMRKLRRDIEETGGIEAICDRIADGESIGSIAKGFGVSRRTLYAWRNHPQGRDERVEMWEAALRLSAEAQLEQSVAEFDRLDRVIDTDALTGEETRRVPLTAEVQLATGRAKWRQWYAGKLDRERFGDDNKGDVNVNLSIGDLHLQALAEVKAREALPPPVVEAEVIE